MSAGIVVFAHGSRIEAANQSVRAVAAELARAGLADHVAAAFLELGEPDLDGAVAGLAAQGVRRIIVIPYFLTLGVHLERDLPRLVARLAALHPGVEIQTEPPLDGHRALLEAVIDRAYEALRRGAGKANAAE